MIRIIITLVLSILLLLLVAQNLHQISFNFLIWSIEISLSLILLMTFIATVILSLMIALPLTIKKMLNKNKKVDLSKEENIK